MKTSIREVLELVIIVGLACLILSLSSNLGPTWSPWLKWLVVILATAKTGYYFGETLLHLVHATACDLPYHRFLVLMGYNMAEVTLSFAIDFYCLQTLDSGSFAGLDVTKGQGVLLFDCFYFSVLNFSFFGYGDILPQTIPAKLVMLLEVVTAFTTVIFLISDFVSMKESMKSQ
jgi:hypothetical protein